MANQPTNAASPEPVAVTGVASGGLGTAANLEDTQLWNLEELGVDEPADTMEPPAAQSEALPEPELVRAAPATPRPAPAPRPAGPVLPVAQQVPAAEVRAPRGQRRTGLMAAAVVGLVALAALLALREGLPGGATRGAGDAAGAFPSLPAAGSIAPQATAVPEAGGGGKDKGNGNGKGKGNGN